MTHDEHLLPIHDDESSKGEKDAACIVDLVDTSPTITDKIGLWIITAILISWAPFLLAVIHMYIPQMLDWQMTHLLFYMTLFNVAAVIPND